MRQLGYEAGRSDFRRPRANDDHDHDHDDHVTSCFSGAWMRCCRHHHKLFRQREQSARTPYR